MATGERAARRGGVHDAAAEGQILERLPFGVLVVDRDLATRFSNAAARALFSHDDGGRGDPPALPVEVADYASRLFESEDEPERELVSAGPRILAVTGVPAHGETTAVVLLADVTDREHRERAERRFIENAAHELRTPVAAIVSVVEALDAGGKHTPEVRDRFLGHLRVHGARLVQLSTSLLALARVQSRDQAAQVELLPLKTFAETIVAGLEPRPGVSIAVDVPETLAVLADEDLLRLAVMNVATNAVKNTSAGEIRFVGRPVSRWADLEIRDTGRGMSEADRDVALARFHRGADQEGGGFGLGLAIAADAIEAVGGRLELASTPGVGTTIRIRLPGAEVR